MAGFFVLQNSLLFSNSFYCVGGVGALIPLAPFYPFLFIKWIFVVKSVKHENKSVKSLIIKYIYFTTIFVNEINIHKIKL
ncbi:hypothetical protein EDM00_11200 [Ornithobacterium rhinotracheale]|nr:hypothetical protein [Ornithobacterium rhinotracheale]